MGPRPRPPAARRQRRRWRLVAVACALLVVSRSGPDTIGGATADVGGDHLTASGVEVGDSLDFYDYGDATPVSAPGDSDWSAGAFLETTASAVPGELTLDKDGGPVDLSEPWWDADWLTRRCIDVGHTAAGAATVTEYQVRVELDTSSLITAGTFDPDAQDLRVARHDGVGFVPLDFWVDPSTLETTATVIWVQVDQITAGVVTDLCLYWNNPAPVPSASSLDATFTYSTRKPLYYTVSALYTGAAGTVAASPYVNGTSFARDAAAPVTANNAQVVTVTGNTAASVYSSTGPLAALGTSNAQDMLVPASLAGTEFVVPTNRSTQRWYVRSPWATTVVQFFNGTTAVGAPVTVTPGAGTVTVTADVTGSRTGIVRSTNGVPFLLTHTSSATGDGVVPSPATTEPLYGIWSRRHYIGYPTTGSTVTVRRSDGTQATVVGGGPNARSDFGAAATQGNGPAAVVAGANNPVGALQQDDGDGVDTTAFRPRRELGSRYLLPVSTQYVAVACPIAGTQISFAGGPGVPCNGATFGAEFIGKARDGTTRAVGATAVSVASVGGQPFHLYFERSAAPGANDEVQVGSYLQGRQFTFPTPTPTLRAEEGGAYPALGVWDSAPIDTGGDGVFGRLSWNATTPTDTLVRFQLATGATQLDSVLAPFVGPDGTSGTYYTSSGTPAAYLHDFDRWVRIRAHLGTVDPGISPQVASVTLDTHLAELGSTLDDPTVLSVNSPAGVPTTTWLARVHTSAPTFAGSTTTLRSANAPVVPDVDAATVAFARPDATEVIVAAETVIQPTGPPIAFTADDPHSIVVDSTVSGPATLDLMWSTLVGGSSPVVEHRFRVEFSG